jgi:hypothetical protein
MTEIYSRRIWRKYQGVVVPWLGKDASEKAISLT